MSTDREAMEAMAQRVTEISDDQELASDPTPRHTREPRERDNSWIDKFRAIVRGER